MHIDLGDSKLICHASTAARFAKQNDSQPVLVAKVLGTPAYQTYMADARTGEGQKGKSSPWD